MAVADVTAPAGSSAALGGAAAAAGAMTKTASTAAASGSAMENTELGIVVTTGQMVNARGKKLHTLQWLPPAGTPPTGLAFLCHGYGDYFHQLPHLRGGLSEVARRLARMGVACFGLELEGHGHSEGTRCHIDKFDYFVDDMVQYIESTSAKHGADLPRFLIGESMGGAVMIKLSRRHPGKFRGAILIAPMVEIHPSLIPPAPVVAILKGMAKVAPKAAIVPGESDKVLEKACHLPEMLDKALKDEFRYRGKARLRMAVEQLNATKDIQKNLAEVKVPLLIIQGEADTVTRAEASQALIDKCSSTDKTFKRFPGMWHAILDEPEPEVSEVHRSVGEWIMARL